ncbi:FAD/FMN-containing dehydrogenase [Bosea sp. 62]|uniref:FAD-binding oxidoreductase n=1 Tax=unclassified Bosea (in: a-proteobacteria) TaxID=2653178 RepID=UPI001250F73B|nr:MULTISPECIES: FAD-binding oxidoreductase [unclassified Bosea (in: a-proteobacteria)]CAD5288954.1 FAD/FMN-containing dehydrogenase [Bosea sp. 21B]CAD5291303.1 FAD/FMN-containing dehydrogenase [Bosea sp. 46]CAD5300613.1 FAD/FMN-containing dehydrogenase [Bosea sp. 7B]VVT60291.1 FAD/FMN-containing dehydrogenase [Bosea sp. EC-HK365B]VXA94305.1 FAD/FMN-containing dehydrogenase [Bosea sp. 62]
MSPLDDLRTALDPAAIVTDPQAMAPHLSDWRGKHRGAALALLRPRSVEEVSAILRWASATRTPVVPQGGNTGLSGGATPDGSGEAVVLSLARLNRIRAIDLEGDTLTAEAGCILADVQQAAAGEERLFPLSLGSEGSCQIGGVVSTNAGGINVIRYGTVRDLVLGLEYVRADGAVIHGLKPLRKDNAGYALKELVIGSEGTLAIVTAATFRLFPRPRASVTALCGLASPVDALRLLALLRQSAGERISSFELMCDGEMGLTLDLVPGTTLPLDGRHAWYVFVELGDSDPSSPIGEMLTQVLAIALEQGMLQDATIAQSEAQARAIWHLRFAVAEANRRAGPIVSHDTSVAVADVPAFISAIEAMAAERFPEARPLFVGHVGDGNIHVILLLPGQTPAEQLADIGHAVNAEVFAIVGDFGGSITAEHGIGRSLVGMLAGHAQPEALELMRAVKQAFDPLDILNPGTVLAQR